LPTAAALALSAWLTSSSSLRAWSLRTWLDRWDICGQAQAGLILLPLLLYSTHTKHHKQAPSNTSIHSNKQNTRYNERNAPAKYYGSTGTSAWLSSPNACFVGSSPSSALSSQGDVGGVGGTGSQILLLGLARWYIGTPSRIGDSSPFPVRFFLLARSTR
jgi:hypothetical protein